MISKKRQSGITLLEVLLVLAIGASILLLSITQFQNFQRDSNVDQLRYNVDTLFQALTSYYKANCYGRLDPTSNPPGKITPGKLHPDNPDVKEFMMLDIKNDLVAAGYLSTNLTSMLPLNPIVDNSDGAVGGYVAQFNQYQSDRLVCTATSGSAAVSGPSDPNCTGTKRMATIITWKIQISVLLDDPDLAQEYLRLTGADCLSEMETDHVRPCSSKAEANVGNYLVWERLPSFASPETSSDYWLLNPTVQQFNQMYTTYPILHLISPPNEGNTGSGNPQYVLCSS